MLVGTGAEEVEVAFSEMVDLGAPVRKVTEGDDVRVLVETVEPEVMTVTFGAEEEKLPETVLKEE